MIAPEELRELKDFKINVDNDEIRFKEIIKRKLLANNKILHVLSDKTLEEAGAEPDEYFGRNIIPYYMISNTQTDVQNFICYEISFDEMPKYNNVFKYNQIIFYILCGLKNGIDKATGIARHDLLSALILEEFNWTNYFGTQIHCVQNKPSIVDTNYACRTLIFEMETLAGITKTKNKIPKVIKNEVHT